MPYKQIVDGFFVSVVVFDGATRSCIFANPVALETLEIADFNLKLEDLFVEEIQGQKTLNSECFHTSENINDILIKKPNGNIFVANLGVNISKKIITLSFEDITHHKKLMRELETKQAELKKNAEDLLRQNKKLVELDKAKDRFFALTSHELRTPLSSIVATSEFIGDDPDLDASEVREYVKVIFEEGKHLLNIINDILDFSKIQAGKLDLYIEKSNLTALLRDRVNHIKKFAQGKSIKINVENCDEEQLAYFDEVRLTEVFDNLLSNAIKYNRDNGSIHVKLESVSAEFIKIAFTDTGIGIPAEFREKIFNEFETVENVRRHHQGTGLGMPISQKLMTLMGGKIYFESQSDIGTTFFIEVPVSKILSPEVYRARPHMIHEVA